MTCAPTKQKLLTVCIIGRPNAGKSTLLNKIVGQKISIVTPKVQTTRSLVTGIITIEDTQLILFDTPGIFEPKKRLEKAMVRCAWSSLNGADIAILILDSSVKADNNLTEIMLRLKELGKDIVFLLNKIDLNSKYYISSSAFISRHFPDSKRFNISALNGEGVESFVAFLKNAANHGSWLYENDDMTDLPMRFLAAEITREQLFLKLHMELPYNLTVESESWENLKDGSIKVNQVIIVSREGYKNIIIGKKGEKIKEIGMKARQGIEELLGLKIHLFLFVKVRKAWEDKPETYQALGLKYYKD